METIKVAAEYREPTPDELAGLARISLAVNSNETAQYIKGMNGIHRSVLRLLHSEKVPNGSAISDNRETSGRRSIAASSFAIQARKRGIRDVWNDAKFSNDGRELIQSIDDVIFDAKGYVSRPHVARQIRHQRLEPRGILPPRYLSLEITNMSDVPDLREAVQHATAAGIEAVGMVSSSKKPDSAFERYGLDNKAITTSMARMAIDAGITKLAAAAGHASFIRDALSAHPDYDQLEIFGTGATICDEDAGEHEVPALVSDVHEAVDVFVIGRPILFHQTPDVHLLEYARAIATGDC